MTDTPAPNDPPPLRLERAVMRRCWRWPECHCDACPADSEWAASPVSPTQAAANARILTLIAALSRMGPRERRAKLHHLRNEALRCDRGDQLPSEDLDKATLALVARALRRVCDMVEGG